MGNYHTQRHRTTPTVSSLDCGCNAPGSDSQAPTFAERTCTTPVARASTERTKRALRQKHCHETGTVQVTSDSAGGAISVGPP